MTKNHCLIGTSVLCGIAVLAGLVFHLVGFRSASLLVGLGVALALVLPSYWSLSWAIRRSDRVFYSVYVGGALGRLTGLFGTAYAVWRTGGLPLTPVLLSLVGSMAALSSIEVYFLRRQMNAR